MPTCKGYKKDGTPCRSSIVRANGYCRAHQAQACPDDGGEPPKSLGRDLDLANLYTARTILSQGNRRALGLTVPASIYVQDPLVAITDPKLALDTVYVDWEPGLTDGPTNARIAVVDYNADTGVLTDAARWDEKTHRFPDADDAESYQFHQVNTWAVVQSILTFYENDYVLGRAIPWAFQGNRLIVVPHAGYLSNAFYDRRSKSLQFYYCGTRSKPVYTCLSHDIIAHEAGHAILDGIRPFYHEISSLQTSAFHEFMADLTAILSALRNNHVRGEIAARSGGDLTKASVIAGLAEQFGQDMIRVTGGKAGSLYLRTALNATKMKHIKESVSPHDCSQVLTGAMFDILTRIAHVHLKEGRSPKEALWRAVDHVTRLSLRPLDYCPPVDVQFQDYARAVLNADELVYPDDPRGYREIAKTVFRERGLLDGREQDHPRRLRFRRYEIERLARSRTAAYHFLNENRRQLRIPPEQDFWVADLYDTNKAGAGGHRLPREIVVEYVWSEDVPLEGGRFGPFAGEAVQLFCGGTLVFDGRGNILSFERKPGACRGIGLPAVEQQRGEERRQRLLEYVANLVERGLVGLQDARWMHRDVEDPVVAAHRVDGSLRLEQAPHLRHWDGAGEGAS